MRHQGDAALDITASPVPEHSTLPGLRLVERLLEGLNRLIVVAASIALIAAAVVLSESVFIRYFLRASTDWQDEISVMLLVGAIFMSAAYVQSVRGHVAIEAVAELLSPSANRLRVLCADGASLAFCAFFAWKSWTLTHEAWVDGQVRDSTFATPLWIPYSLMGAGMSLLAIQILLQIIAEIGRPRGFDHSR
ncbi:MAG: TRAP transporter small permease [Methylobacteriaceae bacterium]|nr:TRAP transporter small permease [Methylobacteriaceae bacterium]